MRRSPLRGRWLVAAVIVLGLIGVVELWRFSQAYSDLRSARDGMTVAADTLRTKGLEISEADLQQTRDRFEGARSQLSGARSTLENDPILFVAGQLPWFSKQIDAARRLTRVGEHSADMGEAAVATIASYQEVRHGSPQAPLGERASDLLAAIRDDMAALKAGLSAVDRERAGIEGGLLGPLDNATDTLDRNIDYLRDQVDLYDQASVIVPEILGFSGPRSYLLLTQDNTEMFPTGGLISVYGIITVDKGRLTGMRFSNVNLLGAETVRTGEYIEPPGPLGRYLLRDWSWNLGTSNWSPDFPTSARQAQFFLDKAGEPKVDGVIATNFLVLEALLDVLGPVNLPEYGVSVNGDNATEMILEQSHNARGLQEGRHVFPSKVADRIFNAALTAPGDKWSSMLDALDRLGKERQIFLYANRPEVQEAISGLGWDGAFIDEGEEDYLMLVETSVLSTKLNLILDEQLRLSTRLDENGNVSHRLQVSYRNPLPEWSRGKSAVLQGQMLGGLYGGYLRLFTPNGTRLTGLQQDGQMTAIEDTGLDQSKDWFGSFFTLPSGASSSVSFSFVSPKRVQVSGDEWEYNLTIQKQSGYEGLPLHVDVFVPTGATEVRATLDGKPLPLLSFDTDLRQDRKLSVQYRLESGNHAGAR